MPPIGVLGTQCLAPSEGPVNWEISLVPRGLSYPLIVLLPYERPKTWGFILIAFFAPISTDCAVEVMEKHENNCQEDGYKKNWCAEFTTHASSSILHFHFSGCLSGSVTPLWAWHYPDAQTESEDWLRRTCVELLAKSSNPQNNGSIWRPRNPLGTVIDWLVHALFGWSKTS